MAVTLCTKTSHDPLSVAMSIGRDFLTVMGIFTGGGVVSKHGVCVTPLHELRYIFATCVVQGGVLEILRWLIGGS